MPAYADSQVALIDDRIIQAQTRFEKMGTVVGRDGTGPGCEVILDGSSGVPSPVKCFENVIVVAGDRVGLIKYEGEWIVTGNYTLRTLADEVFSFDFTSSVNNTSATYVDMPSSPAVSLTKMRDTTNLRLHVDFSCWTSVAATSVKVGLHVQSADASVTFDQDMRLFTLNTAAKHDMVTATRQTAATLPAGGYTVTGRWLRFGGTGNLTTDTSDSVQIEVREVF
jgi:hypothetical protein